MGEDEGHQLRRLSAGKAERTGGLAASSRNPPSDRGHRTKYFHHASLPSRACSRRFVLFHGEAPGTAPLADGTHRCLTRGLPFRAHPTAVPYRCHGHPPRSPPLHLDVTAGRCGFLDTPALDQIVFLPRYRAGGAVIIAKANETRTGHLATAILGARAGIKGISVRTSTTFTSIPSNMGGCRGSPIGRIRASIDSCAWGGTHGMGGPGGRP